MSMLDFFGESPGRDRTVARRENRALAAHTNQMADVFRTGELNRLKDVVDRKLAEGHVRDISDVYETVKQEAGDDPVLAALLIPIVADYAKQKRRKINGSDW